MSNDLIVKANKIVEAGYNLTTSEQRLILSAISQIPKGEEVRADKVYIVTINDFKAFGVHEKTAYRDFKEACNKIYDRSINIREGDENTFKTRWVQQVVIGDSDWLRRTGVLLEDHMAMEDDYMLVGIMFSNPIVPYLTNLTIEFTKYLKSDLVGVTSHYTIRFYEFICQYRSIGKREISIESLRYMLNLGNKYPAVGDLKRWVIDIAINEINEKTPMKVQYKLRKTGRKYTHLLLTFKEQAKTRDVTPKKKHDTDDLTDAERQIVTGHVKQYIETKKIIDENHKNNIINKAMKERWGLDENDDKQAEEEKKYKQKLAEEKQREKEEKQKDLQRREKAQKELEKCEEKFLALSKTMQKIILENLANQLGMFKKDFEKDLQMNDRAYADIKYSAKFKEIMKDV